MKIYKYFLTILSLLILMNLGFVASCDGCENDGECYEFGEIFNETYCDHNTLNLIQQKEIHESCTNDFECLGDLTCTENICFDLVEGLVSLGGISNQLNDSDGDFILNMIDNCINNPNYNQLDSDGDLIGEVCDNCPSVPNSGQNDSDSDGTGDLCESSQDNNSEENDSDSSEESRATYKVYTINPSVFENGYSIYLRKGDKIKFMVDEEYHTLEIKGISKNKVKVEIKSKTFNTELYLNQIQKFDLTSNGYYDLSVLLRYVTDDTSRAKIAIKQLNEKTAEDTSSDTIVNDGSLDNAIDGTDDIEDSGVSGKTYLRLIVWIFLIVSFVLVLAALFILFFKEKKKVTNQKPLQPDAQGRIV
jgi:hypothetical protein